MTDLSELQELISTIRARRGFTTEPAQLVCLLAEEVGEVVAEVKKTWSPNYPDLVPSELGDELADAFVLISALASSFRIDLETAVRARFLEVDGARHWASAGEQTPDDEP